MTTYMHTCLRCQLSSYIESIPAKYNHLHHHTISHYRNDIEVQLRLIDCYHLHFAYKYNFWEEMDVSECDTQAN